MLAPPAQIVQGIQLFRAELTCAGPMLWMAGLPQGGEGVELIVCKESGQLLSLALGHRKPMHI